MIAALCNIVVIEVPNPMRPLAAEANAAEARAALRELGHRVQTILAGQDLIERLVVDAPDFAVPCVSPGLSGDGALQELLEVIDLPYAGSSASVVRTCADKVVTKQILQSRGLPVLTHRVVSNRAIVRWRPGEALSEMVNRLGDRVVIKPVHGSGAMGVKLVAPADDLARRIVGALNYDSEIMVEPYVAGREFSVLAVGPCDGARVLGIAEVFGPVSEDRPSPSHWERLYRPAGNVPQAVNDLAAAAYSALGCRDAAAVDFVLDADGNPWILEVETALDFATDGPVACAVASAGLSTRDAFGELARRLTAVR